MDQHFGKNFNLNTEDYPESKEPWIKKTIIVFTVGSLVFFLSFICSWLNDGFHLASKWHGIWQEFNYGEKVYKEIIKYKKTNGSLPETLKDLVQGNPDSYLKKNEQGEIVDQWDTPYSYTISGEEFELFSYGIDKKIGGEGMYSDIYFPNMKKNSRHPTFKQFTNDLPSDGFKHLSFVSSLISMILTWLSMSLQKPRDDESPKTGRWRKIRIFLSFIAIIIATLFFSAVLSVLEIPTGH